MFGGVMSCETCWADVAKMAPIMGGGGSGKVQQKMGIKRGKNVFQVRHFSSLKLLSLG